MKTLRRLVLVALFAAAAPAFAGPPAENVSQPKTFTPADLKANLGRYKVVEEAGEGDEKTFTLSNLYHSTQAKESVSWTVSLRVHTRKGRPPVVRIFFPCQVVKADANAETLALLLSWNGIAADTAAYFVIGGEGKNRMLQLVSEVPTEGLTDERIREEVESLFRSAETTMSVWGADLTKPPVKK